MASVAPLRSLLLLPSPPTDVSFSSVKAAYKPPLTQVLEKALQESKARSQCTVLDIALVCPSGLLAKDQPRGVSFDNFQKLLGSVYGLICDICAKESIDIENDNDVDARIILIQDEEEPVGGEGSVSIQSLPVPLHVLAAPGRDWEHIYSPQGENDGRLLQHLQGMRQDHSLAPSPSIIEKVADGSYLNDHSTPMSNPSTGSAKRHYSVAVGGTFDHLHAGHKLLLAMTALALETDKASKGRSLTVGITGDALLQKKEYADQLQSWEDRQTGVRYFLQDFLGLSSGNDPFETTSSTPEEGNQGKTIVDKFKSGLIIRYVEIFDPFGPTITDEAISALVISAETRAGGKAVNDKRMANGWSPLEVFEVDVLGAQKDAKTLSSAGQDFKNKISSTEIRKKLHEKAERKR